MAGKKSDDGNDWVSTTWDQIDAAVDTLGYREGFVRVFLEFRGAVLDDMPLDAKGRPEVVNQSNFARHFGIAISTFHRWLSDFGGPEFALEGERKEKAEAAKDRQKDKAKKKDRDAIAQEVRRRVAQSREDFDDKLTVRRADDGFWFIDVDTLVESELPGREKAKAIERWLEFLDGEAEALGTARDKLLSALTELEAGVAAA
jgi:hypothetical protein